MPRPRARRAAALASLVALVGAAACRDLGFEPQSPESVTFAPSLGITLSQFTRLPSGVYVRDLAVGSGTVVDTNSTITMSYRGFLASGQPFDTNYATSASPPTALVAFVPGFRDGLLGARQGSRRQLIIPPALGYGSRTTPTNSIPAGSVLFFDVNLTSVVTPAPPTTPAARLP